MENKSDSEDEKEEVGNNSTTGGAAAAVIPRSPILGPDPSIEVGARTSKRKKKPKLRTIFHKALDAIRIDWDNQQLKLLLTHDVPPAGFDCHTSGDGHFLWHGMLR